MFDANLLNRILNKERFDENHTEHFYFYEKTHVVANK